MKWDNFCDKLDLLYINFLCFSGSIYLLKTQPWLFTVSQLQINNHIHRRNEHIEIIPWYTIQSVSSRKALYHFQLFIQSRIPIHHNQVNNYRSQVIRVYLWDFLFRKLYLIQVELLDLSHDTLWNAYYNLKLRNRRKTLRRRWKLRHQWKTFLVACCLHVRFKRLK